MKKIIQWFVGRFKGRFVKKLIRGSYNIDRMRREIDEVVSMILGMPCIAHLKDSPEKVHWIARSSANRNYGWILRTSSGELIASFFHGDEELPTTYYSSRFTTSNGIKLRHVKCVHDHLDLFVERMMESYPDLRKDLQPLINAA